MVELTKEQFEAAKVRGEATRRRGPLAAAVRYDAERNRIVVRLNTGSEIAFDPAEVCGLEHAALADLENVVLTVAASEFLIRISCLHTCDQVAP